MDFLKCYCPKTKQYFFMKLKKNGSLFEVDDVTLLSDADAAKVSSTVRQESFKTATHLLPCRKCGSRKVGGCSCFKNDCKVVKGEYEYQCTFCSNLKIIYDRPTDSSGVVILGQNESINLSSLCYPGEDLDEIYLSGGWNPAEDKFDIDVDFSAVLVSDTGRELVFYNKLEDDAKSVHVYGDSRDGKTKYGPGGDNECIKILLSKVPAKYKEVHIIVTVYSGHKLSEIKNLHGLIYTKNRSFLRNDVAQYYGNANAMHLAKFTRTASGWTFSSIGKYTTVDDVVEMADYVSKK